MAERLIALVSKTGIPLRYRGFKSHRFRQKLFKNFKKYVNGTLAQRESICLADKRSGVRFSQVPPNFINLHLIILLFKLVNLEFMAPGTSWRRSLPFQGREAGSKPVGATKNIG